MSCALHSVVRLLAKAEAEILLLARSHPINWRTLQVTLPGKWSRGERSEPVLEFQPPPDLRSLRAGLAYASRIAAREGRLGIHLCSRAAELDEEASLVEQIGKRSFRERAALHYARRGGDADSAADALAAAWARLEPEQEAETGVLSDDFSSPSSLVNQLRDQSVRLGLSLPIRVDRRLAAVATVDRNGIWVRAGELLSRAEARRIAVHETFGHAVRRAAALRPANLLSSSGFALSDEDEEGRAIWLESEMGHQSRMRRIELARRHLAARACLSGASFVETMDLLAGIGTRSTEGLPIVLRVWRGGGLAREVIYLRGYARASRTLANDPDIEAWMTRGRFSIEVAAELASGELSWPLDTACPA